MPKVHRFHDVMKNHGLAPRDTPVFDLRPIEIGAFSLRGRCVRWRGRPLLEDWTKAMQVAVGAQDASPYWVGDLLMYAETREDWRGLFDQALAMTGFTPGHVYNLHHISQHVAEEERLIAPTIGHAAVVTKFKATEQRALLEEAREHGWNVHEFRREVRAKSRRKVIEGQAILKGQYRVLYADCPWLYRNKPKSGSGAQDHYHGMTVEQLMALPVARHAYPNAVLFFWVPQQMLYFATEPEKGPDPYRVIRAWEFTPKTGMVWDKVLQAGGSYVGVRHEHLLIATRGSCTPDHPVPQPDSLYVERRSPEHSEKPKGIRTLIERLYEGPRMELFARERFEGWDSFGDDAKLWTTEQTA